MHKCVFDDAGEGVERMFVAQTVAWAEKAGERTREGARERGRQRDRRREREGEGGWRVRGPGRGRERKGCEWTKFSRNINLVENQQFDGEEDK